MFSKIIEMKSTLIFSSNKLIYGRWFLLDSKECYQMFGTGHRHSPRFLFLAISLGYLFVRMRCLNLHTGSLTRDRPICLKMYLYNTGIYYTYIGTMYI